MGMCERHIRIVYVICRTCTYIHANTCKHKYTHIYIYIHVIIIYAPIYRIVTSPYTQLTIHRTIYVIHKLYEWYGVHLSYYPNISVYQLVHLVI